MGQITHPDLGRVWLPEPTLSIPGRPTFPRFAGVVLATQRRPGWSVRGLLALPEITRPRDPEREVRELLAPFRAQLDPRLFDTQVIWSSVTHNERVNAGGGHNANRLFGTVGASNAVGTIVAVATTGFTSKTATDQSIGSASSGATTNEFTTIGFSRAAGTVQNYVAATTLSGTYAADIFKSFTSSGSGTAHGAGLFDQVTVAGSILLAEDTFTSDAIAISGDTLQITWTWNG